MDGIRVNIQVCGIVQGVGFRPFLHRQMEQLSLSGWIRNTSEGVEIEAEGREADADALVFSIKNHAPVLAAVEEVRVERFARLKGYENITILPSRHMDKRNTLVSPDVATCPDCLRELFDSKDRRSHYPFINCTNCGPRFSIIRDLPYDRCNTTMTRFAMCPDCAAEYERIADRRYHAQPDCCGDCGPELFFLDGEGKKQTGDPIRLAADALRAGKIIAVKGLGGVHLACRWNDSEIVRELRSRKRRDEKPLAVMCRDLETVRKHCRLSAEEQVLLTGHARPILLLEKRNAEDFPHLSDNRCLGVMLPYTPVHHLLLDAVGESLVMTSANLSDLPIIIENGEAVQKLRGVADGFLLNNRDIENRCDDSLARVVSGKSYFLRRSRGYAPLPVYLYGGKGGTLACGAEQKASFSLSRGRQVFLSAHIGDLKNAETLNHYEKQIALFERLFDVKPERIVCDLHPDYLSADYARRRAGREKLPLMTVQHHHAHMASCMADNGLEGSCIGIIWDGTGYGTDGTIWGGEFLAGDYRGFERAGSLRPMKLPGGDRAVKEIWRVGASLMLDAGLEPAAAFPDQNTHSISALLAAGLNCPLSSGMGRLFDGVSAIIGIRQAAGYEGQGAVLLEAAADEGCVEAYPVEIVFENGMHIYDYRSMVAAVCADMAEGLPAGRIAARFMNTLVCMAREMCRRIRAGSGLNRVVLSGGVFQNMFVLKRLAAGLGEDGFEVYHHLRVSTNDEGISFGQLAIAERGGGIDVPCGTAENY